MAIRDYVASLLLAAMLFRLAGTSAPGLEPSSPTTTLRRPVTRRVDVKAPSTAQWKVLPPAGAANELIGSSV